MNAKEARITAELAIETDYPIAWWKERIEKAAKRGETELFMDCQRIGLTAVGKLINDGFKVKVYDDAPPYGVSVKW